jgi:hypothetical protein|tara:strand:- start:1601 stop:1996 length:396 start_codon:yes stop_codon:yes gene_type:complete
MWQKAPFDVFIAQHLSSNGLGRPPLTDSTVGKVDAYINSGRWVVDCKVELCGGAAIVSDKFRYFMCAECGNNANNGNWYHVVFPADRERIEELLLRRPALKPMEAGNRNWVVDETVKELEDENTANGIDAS